MTYRSIDPGYHHTILKEYTYWTLLLNENQRYFGRAVIWLVRSGSLQRLTELTGHERIELWEIMRAYESALEKAGYTPDHVNYAWLGNDFRMHGGHGHMHVVPRWNRIVHYHGVAFTDDRWGRMYDGELPWERGRLCLFRSIQALLIKHL